MPTPNKRTNNYILYIDNLFVNDCVSGNIHLYERKVLTFDQIPVLTASYFVKLWLPVRLLPPNFKFIAWLKAILI